MIKPCTWEDIKHLPETYNTGGALFMRRKAQEFWFKAEIAGFTVGCACVFAVSKNRARLSNVFVIPNFRGKGIGKALVEAREDWARQNGFAWIEARTKETFYYGMGYVLKTPYAAGDCLEKQL